MAIDQSQIPLALGVSQPSSTPPLAVVAMDKRRGFKGRATNMASGLESSGIQEASGSWIEWFVPTYYYKHVHILNIYIYIYVHIYIYICISICIHIFTYRYIDI